MQQSFQAECPYCSRMLQKFNGHIGYCPQHKWVSPLGLGYEAEAAEQNRKDAEEEEKSRLVQEQKRLEEIERIQREQHRKMVRKAVLGFLSVLLIAAGLVYFVVRPGMKYKNAGKYFEAADYESAREQYSGLGTYKDSAARVVLCEAMIDLQDGRPDDAAEKLDQLTGEGQKELSGKIVDALQPVLADWKTKGLTPQMLLKLLQKPAVAASRSKTDIAKLILEGHAALLDEEPLSITTMDVNGDGNPEMVVLNADHSVSVYRMSAESNLLIPVEDDVMAECLIQLGDGVKDADPVTAASCYMDAFRLQESPETGSAMKDTISYVLREWKMQGIDPAEILGMVQAAEEMNIDLTGIDRNKVFQEAALAAAWSPVQYDFTDWNQDGYEELLTAYMDGKLVLYGIDNGWHALSTAETKLSAPFYTMTGDNSAPLILVSSGEKDELAVLNGAGNKLSELFRESGINNLNISSIPVTFSRELSGSIARHEDFRYNAENAASRPERTGIDWLQENYPQPDSAEAAVRRYWESRAYNIPEETALLISSSSEDALFSPDLLSSLPSPSSVDDITVVSYWKEDAVDHFEVCYSYGTKTVRSWISAENNGEWKVAGASDSYSAGKSTQNVDFSIPLISLNAEMPGELNSKGSRATYRVMLPQDGRLKLVWKSGNKITGSVSYNVSMVRDSLDGESIFSYGLKPSPNIQQTTDLFVSAGVYYLFVEAKTADAAPYSVMLSFISDENVEQESNDTYQTATEMSLNTAFSGNLSSAADIDWYSFALDEAAQVNVTLGTSGTGRGTSHTMSVYSGSDGSALTVIAVPGNSKLTETGTLYLSAGTYLVQVAKGSSPLTSEYTLTVNSAQSAGNTELEANNSYETANLIPLNEEVLGSIGKDGDIDCYRFTLDADAVVQPRFGFKPTDSSSKTYVLTLADGNGKELLKTNVGGKESAKIYVPLALPAGTYYLKIENPRFVRQDYTLQLVSMPVVKTEQEINDSLGLANELTAGHPVTGVLASETDNDCFKLSFIDMTTVTLNFSFAPTAVTGTAFVLTIEQNGKTQWTANVKGDSGMLEQQLQFPAGEYYLRIKPSVWISAVYTLEMK